MALHDAATLPADHEIEADLCIIGSGAAGLTIAHALRDAGHRIVVLESGGLDFDEHAQDLNDGAVVGTPYRELRRTWLRQFGGTTNHWTAFVRPLDAQDFAARPWVPHAGWPIDGATLAPYYRRASATLDLPGNAFDLDAWVDSGHAPWPFEPRAVDHEIVQVVAARRQRLAKTIGAAVRAAANVSTYLHATVVEIVPDRLARTIDRLRVVTSTGAAVTARARLYVLAAGGIENARLLLLSSSVQPNGVGNDHDLVGRYFGNHFSVDLGTITSVRRGVDLSFYAPRLHAHGIAFGTISFKEPVYRDHKLLNVRFQVQPLRGGASGAPVDPTESLLAQVDRLTRSAGEESRTGLARFAVAAMAEPAPNPESRVRLGDVRDRLGQRQVVLDWRISEESRASVGRATRRLARELGAAGIGRLQSALLGGQPGNLRTDSFHHIGTTRMHTSAREGVVDASCRVHGLANLYVAGSSVFPTCGTANPTYTIIALAERLADHLKERLA